MASTKVNVPRGNTTPNLTIIDGGKATSKLTGKQLAYVQAILKGANQSDAYREAYNAENMSDQAIWTEAGRLFRLSRTRFPWTQNWLNRSVQGGPEHDRQF